MLAQAELQETWTTTQYEIVEMGLLMFYVSRPSCLCYVFKEGLVPQSAWLTHDPTEKLGVAKCTVNVSSLQEKPGVDEVFMRFSTFTFKRKIIGWRLIRGHE